MMGRKQSNRLFSRSLFVDQNSRLRLGGGFLSLMVLGVTASASHAQVIVEGWGDTGFGQRTVPTVLTGLPSSVTSISGGGLHYLAIENGAVYNWGNNNDGQLGNGKLGVGGNIETPAIPGNLSTGVTAVSGGGFHSLAVGNGGVYAWGSNLSGQLGISPIGVFFPEPVPVTNLSSGVTSIAAGANHSLAIQNASVFAWGSNSNGQLGNDSSIGSASSLPVAVVGLSSGITAIAAGASHSLAIQNGGVVRGVRIRTGNLATEPRRRRIPELLSQFLLPV